MNRIIAGLAIAGAIVAAQPPDAHGDPGTDHGNGQFMFTVDMARAGIPLGTPMQEIYLAELVCDNLRHGMPIAETVRRLIPVDGAQVAVTIVSAAVMDVCPEFTPAQNVPAPSASAPAAPVPVTIAGSTHGALA